MDTVLFYSDDMANYCFGPTHPMQPERFTLAVELAREWGLLDAAGSDNTPQVRTHSPAAADDEDLLLIHTPRHVDAVKRVSEGDVEAGRDHGIGPGDTPAFPRMHDVTALIVGATSGALESVLSGKARRAFSPAGGLHHAHRDYASGFCVYNDAAVAIEKATRAHNGVRVAYVDVDAHHGDGVEDAFCHRKDVLTLSVHESGQYLFPGTGRLVDTGTGEGAGFALNVPLPPSADSACYDLVLEQVIAPALRAFQPHVIVGQIGGDSHRADPLTHLHQTVQGSSRVVAGLIALSEELCGGRIVLLGGGGYEPLSTVPRMWALALAQLAEVVPPDDLPSAWLELSAERARALGRPVPPALHLYDEWVPDLREEVAAEVLEDTRGVIRRLRVESPLLPD